MNKVHGNKRFNEYNLDGLYGIGYTRKGEEFYFDLEDYSKIKNLCWSVGGRGALVCRNSSGGTPMKFHKLIIGSIKSGLEIDHKNRNQLDNRKNNLRVCKHVNNVWNMGKRKTNSSGTIGVHKRKDTGKYSSEIFVDGVKIALGCYFEIDEAIVVRLKAEKKYFGEFSPQKNLFKKYNI